MRSWAFLILEAATISMALVILRVFCTLLILLRISLEPGISFPWDLVQLGGGASWPLVGAVLLPVVHRRLERLFVVRAHVLLVFQAVHQRRELGLEVIAQALLGSE